MRQHLLWIYCACLTAVAGLLFSSIQASDLRFKAGLGYEFLSQDFYLDSVGTSIDDTLAAVTQFKTTYLDNLKAQFSLRYQPLDNRTLEFQADLDQTSDLMRLRLANRYRPNWGPFKIDWQGEFDWRKNVGDGADRSDAYIYGYSRAKLMLPISARSTLSWQLRGDVVQFDSVAAPSFNHYRIGGEVGYSLYFADYSSLSFKSFMQGRKVADSTRLDYLSYGLEGSLLAFYGLGGELDVYTRLEVKDYNQLPDEGDYLRAETTIRHKLPVKGQLFAKQELEVEAITYDQSDLYTANNTRLSLDLLMGYDWLTFVPALGPHLEYLNEADYGDYMAGEGYFEGGLQAEVDYIDAARVFVSAESVTGRRSLTDESDYLTDFTFERINLLADLRLWRGLNFTALLSAEWEWHDQADENSRIMVLSSGLSYTF